MVPRPTTVSGPSSSTVFVTIGFLPCFVNFSVWSLVVVWRLSPAGGAVLSFSFTSLFGARAPLGACCAFHAARLRSLLRLCSSAGSVEGPPKVKVLPPAAGVGAGGGGGAGFGGGGAGFGVVGAYFDVGGAYFGVVGASFGGGGAGFAAAGFAGGLEYGPTGTEVFPVARPAGTDGLGVGSAELPGRPLEGGLSGLGWPSVGPDGGGGGGRALMAARLMRAASGGGGGGGWLRMIS